ncbi:hypothetical protein O3P69_015078 [Scylla paramamosain]|uniref:Uncharacterized protein n=1 Tax=Scylla paramamosain TaxID=85552 RepID=A0AAW0T4D0_SCYPA
MYVCDKMDVTASHAAAQSRLLSVEQSGEGVRACEEDDPHSRSGSDAGPSRLFRISQARTVEAAVLQYPSITAAAAPCYV